VGKLAFIECDRVAASSDSELLAMTHPLRIGVLVELRYLSQAQPCGMMAALRRRGHEVVVIVVEDGAQEIGVDAWLEGLDLIVARGRAWHLLCLLDWAEARKTHTINRRASIGAVCNKAEMEIALARAGLPIPRSFIGSIEGLARRVRDTDFPLILKPIFGDNGRGLRMVSRRAELADLGWPEPIVLAQCYMAGPGHDLKLYGIGRQVWAVRKPSPLEGRGGTSHRAEPVETTPALQKLGRRCADLFGLELYGVDCIETEDGPVVIEVNDFPNFTGVPSADERLAEYVVLVAPRHPRPSRRLRSIGASRLGAWRSTSATRTIPVVRSMRS
jgi:ribosomal protein S6--L-glutamate ligase